MTKSNVENRSFVLVYSSRGRESVNGGEGMVTSRRHGDRSQKGPGPIFIHLLEATNRKYGQAVNSTNLPK